MTRERSVWILNHYANIPEHPAPTRHHDLARRLLDRGFAVTVVASSFSRVPSALPVAGTERLIGGDVDGVRWVWLRSNSQTRGNDATRVRNMLEFAVRLGRDGRSCFRGEAPRPDVIVGSSPHLFTALVGWRLARRFRVPFVMEVRDLWPETFVGFGFWSARHPIVRVLRRLERFLYRRADRIVVLMPEAWRYITRLAGVAEEKVVWIPNGACVGADEIGGADSGPRPFTVLYMGAHGRANVLDDLLTAARLLQDRGSDVRFELVGGGKEKERLLERARGLALRNLEFRDPVPRTEVEATLSQADALVALLEDTPLYQYGISLNKLFDYMAAGKPVVLAGNAAHNYVELAGCGVTVPPRDPEALARAIADLAAMPGEARRTMGARGRAYVREHHDWDLLADRLAGVLNGVCDARRREST